MNYLNGAQNGLDKELKKWELDLRYIWYKKFDLPGNILMKGRETAVLW